MSWHAASFFINKQSLLLNIHFFHLVFITRKLSRILINLRTRNLEIYLPTIKDYLFFSEIKQNVKLSVFILNYTFVKFR